MLLPRVGFLLSYAYIDSVPEEYLLGISDRVSWLIDSGAFTDFANRRKAKINKTKYTPLQLSQYISTLEKIKKYVWQYIAMDVIGDREGTRKNLNIMLDAGLKPMPVMVIGEPDETAAEYVKINPRLCVAGGVTEPSPWLVKRMLSVNKVTGGIARPHCLGYARLPDILKLRNVLASGDSSTWAMGSKFGLVASYDKTVGKFIKIQWHGIEGTDEKSRKLIMELADYGIPINNIAKKSLSSGYKGIPAMTTIKSYYDFHAHVNSVGVQYFFALCNASNLLSLVGVLDGFEGRSWNYARAVESYTQLNSAHTAGKITENVDRMRKILERTTTWQNDALFK